MRLSSFTGLVAVRRVGRKFHRRLRQARLVAQALSSQHHPVLAHIIPIRRCNLSCAYCNEYDSVSKPVPTDEMLARLDRLAALGTATITFSGGEPLLHPDLDRLIARVREHGRFATLITNGYLLTSERIQRLNRAGLDQLQISIDNVRPDDVSKKSLKVLDQKLRWLAEYATFDVNINSVIGSGVSNPQDALAVARRAMELKFSYSVGITHDHQGQLAAETSKLHTLYDRLTAVARGSYMTLGYYRHFQKNLLEGKGNEWHCRAGSRYLYVCEDGLVHYCSQQRGHPGIPLADYTRAHLDIEYHRQKPCYRHCTVSCVHFVAMLDAVRENPSQGLRKFFPVEADGSSRMPVAVRLAARVFPPENRGRPASVTGRIASALLSRVLAIKPPGTAPKPQLVQIAPRCGSENDTASAAD